MVHGGLEIDWGLVAGGGGEGVGREGYKVVEELKGRKKKITGGLAVDYVSGNLAFVEIQNDGNDNLLSKRKIHGIVNVYVNDGIKLVELFEPGTNVEREILGEIRKVKLSDGSEKLVEESITPTGQKKSREITGSLTVIGTLTPPTNSPPQPQRNQEDEISENQDDEYQIESAKIVQPNPAQPQKVLVLQCKSISGYHKELTIRTGGMMLDGQNKELYEVKENGDSRLIHGSIRILGDGNDLEMVEEITDEGQRLIRRVITGTVKVRSFITINENEVPKVGNSVNFSEHSQAGKSGKDQSLKSVRNSESRGGSLKDSESRKAESGVLIDTSYEQSSQVQGCIEPRGNILSVFNEFSGKEELFDQIYDEKTQKLTSSLIDVREPLTKIITANSIVEETLQDPRRDCEIVRTLKWDLYIIKDAHGCRIIEAPPNAKTRVIIGSLNIISARSANKFLESNSLVEEWVEKDNILRRRDIIGDLEVFTKENGEMSLRENLTAFADQDPGQSEFKIIHGVIKSTGDGKQIIVDQYDDLGGNRIRREICGVLTEKNQNNFIPLQTGSQLSIAQSKSIHEKIFDDEGNEKFIPIKGTIKIIPSNRINNKHLKHQFD